MEEEKSIREQRIRRITNLYYSKPEIQKAIYEFSKSREICPRYFEGFGKRPDIFEYPGDIFELVKRGATSFHCSEEIWKEPLKIQTGMNEDQLNDLREGWDLLIDIDCKWFDYAKLTTEAVISVLRNNGVKNIGIKFSGSKGFHMIVPWKAFPKEINGVQTKNMFPELPRKIVSFIMFKAEEEMKKNLPEDFYEQFKGVEIKRGKKCNSCNEMSEEYLEVNFKCDKCTRKEIHKKRKHEEVKELKCPEDKCLGKLIVENSMEFNECRKCGINSKQNFNSFSRHLEIDLFDLMGLDLILVSPRHLFRTPYSLHEKTSLSSVVLIPEEIPNFELKDADPMKVKIRNFMPDSGEGEAKELLVQALDWDKEISPDKSQEKKSYDFKPIKILNVSDKNFPPSIQKILNGISDGKKRALFILINFFRSVNIEREELEKRIDSWNEKNKPSLKKGYIQSQLLWAYRNKIVPPPNFDKDYYKGIGIVPTEEELRYKNPINYVVKKTFNFKGKKKK